MTRFAIIKIKTLNGFSKIILSVFLFSSFSNTSSAQSPKKLLKNGFYERAYSKAVYKQNKKIKLKKKHVNVITDSYEIIYKKQNELILSSETNWQQSYSAFIRLVKLRMKVTHPGVDDKLKNVLFEPASLDVLAAKTDGINQKELESAQQLESKSNYLEALGLLEAINLRQKELLSYSSLYDRLSPIDCAQKMTEINKKIGNDYIRQAKVLLDQGSKPQALSAIDLIKKADGYRPLDFEEKELLKLADLIIGASWITEAQKLMQTKTKRNARLAFELITRASAVRVLTTEEEKLKEAAKDLGTTRVQVNVKGENTINNSQSLSGSLNKGKQSPWIAFYHTHNPSVKIDYVLEVSETQPNVVLGALRKKITQESKKIDYYEEETDSTGKTKKVKKTRTAIAMVAYLSRTKTAQLKWSIHLNDIRDGKAEYSEIRTTTVEHKNEYVSLESGDILALPDNIETGVDLDSQPFPTDKEMLSQVTQKYLSELNLFINSKKDHMRNISNPIED